MWKIYEDNNIRGAARLIITDKFPEKIEDILDLNTYDCKDGYRDLGATKTGIETIVIEEGIYGLKTAIAEANEERVSSMAYVGANLIAINQLPGHSLGIAGCIFHNIFDIVAVAPAQYNEPTTFPFTAKYKSGRIFQPAFGEENGGNTT